MDRGHEAEEDRAAGGQPREQPQHRAIERDFRGARKVRRAEIAQQPDGEPRQADADRGRTQGEQTTLREQVAHHAAARRAQRRAHGELATSARHARDEQVRCVRAGDQPDERDRDERETRDRADVADHERLQIHHAPRRLVVLIRDAPDGKDAAVDRAQFVGGQRSIRFVPETRQWRDEERTLARRRRPLRGDEEFLIVLQRSERGRQHARHPVVRSIERDRPADRVRAPAEAPLPESVADDHRGRTSGSAIRFREITSHRRLDAQD